MAEDYESTLKANLKKLSELGSGIEGLKEGQSKKIGEHELAIHRLTNLSKDFVNKDDLKELKASLDAMNRRIDGLERNLRDSVKQLSQIDAEIIDELGKVQGLFVRIEGAEVKMPAESPKAAKEPKDRKAELGKEKDRLLTMLSKFTEDYNAGKISKEIYEDALRGCESRLKEIDADSEKLK